MRPVLLRSLTLVAVLVVPVSAPAQALVRVVAPEAFVHLRPDAASPVLLTVAAGTLLEIEHDGAEWFAVLLPAGPEGLRRAGFIAASAVEAQPAPSRAKPASGAFAAPLLPAPTALPAPDLASDPRNEATDWAREGPFVGVTLPFHRFRGSTGVLLTTGSDLLIVPMLQSNYGFGVSVGQHFPTSAVEVSYVRSTHSSTAVFDVGRPGRPSFLLFDNESTYNRLTVDFKRYLVRRWRLQPYVLGGFGLPWLQVRQGGLVENALVDVTLNGVGAQGGAGALFFLHRRFAVQAGAVYRYDVFLSVRGGGGAWSEIQDAISVHGLDVVTGLSFLF